MCFNCLVKSSEIKKKPTVLVAMATYNGARFIREQIDTIICQEDVIVKLVICDDGSHDGTVEICKSYARSYDNIVFTENEVRKGVVQNFLDSLYTLDASKYDYFAFADQDDYWLPGKLKRAVEMIELYGCKDAPCVYYSDIINVDEQLNNPRYEYRAFSALSNNLKALLVCNWAMGCTMVFNRSMCVLLQSTNALPCRTHDSWVHLVAMVVRDANVVADLDESRILRRITGKNVKGESGLGSLNLNRLKTLIRNYLGGTHHTMTKCAKDVVELYGDKISNENKDTLLSFASCRDSVFSRCRLVLDPDYRMPYISETLLLKAKILLNRF